MSIKLLSKQDGDTIIEVLMAMTVVGLVLAGAYVTASRNLGTSQFSQERTNATRIAESQIEQIKAMSIPPAQQLGIVPTSFCVDLTQTPQLIDANDPSAPQACTEDVLYHKSISIGGAGGDVYKVVIEWTPPNSTDGNLANVTLVYKSP